MGIYVLEDKSLATLVKKINKLEEESNVIMVGSIGTYVEDNDLSSWSDGSLHQLKPKNKFMATMRTIQKEKKVII